MGHFDQGGADGPFGATIKTKKALKELCANHPDVVRLYTTSAFGGFHGKADELPANITFNVVGPDPYTARKWYASVTNRDGKVKVS